MRRALKEQDRGEYDESRFQRRVSSVEVWLIRIGADTPSPPYSKTPAIPQALKLFPNFSPLNKREACEQVS